MLQYWLHWPSCRLTVLVEAISEILVLELAYKLLQASSFGMAGIT
jgi:hypothetical protein